MYSWFWNEHHLSITDYTCHRIQFDTRFQTSSGVVVESRTSREIPSVLLLQHGDHSFAEFRLV